MAHMMAQNQRPSLTGAMQDLTPEETAFLQRLMGGQGGDVSSFLEGGPAGDLFTGGPGQPTPELPEFPVTPPTPPILTDPPVTPPAPSPEGDDTPIDIPPEPVEENWWEVDANNNGIPDAWEEYYPGPEDTPDDTPIIYELPPTYPQIPTVPPTTTSTTTSTPTSTPTGDPLMYPHGGASADASAEAKAIALAGGGQGGQGGEGGTGVGQGGTLAGIQGGIHFNMGGPAQTAVDVTMDAYDRYQQALLDKYYADTLRDLGMAALGGGSGGGRDVVGPVGYSNLVTGALARYQQPKPFVKKERPGGNPDWPPPPQNPTPGGGVPPPPSPPFGTEGVARAAMSGAPAAEGGDFDAGQFLSEVQADVAGGVQGKSFLPPTPPREDDWDEGDTEEFVEKMYESPGPGSGPMVDPGLQPGRLAAPSKRALASLLQRPPEVEKSGPIYRHMGGDRPPFPISKPPAARSGIDQQFADIMGGAGAPLGGQIAGQVEKAGQAEEFENLATANRRGLEMAQATYGFKGQERGLQQEQDRFRQQKAQDVMANLMSKRGQRGGPRTRVRVRT